MTTWWLAATVAVYLCILTGAKDDVLVFIFSNIYIRYNSENLEQLHNCMCDSTSISCSVLSSFNVTVKSTKQNSADPLDNDYLSAYECQFGSEDALNMVCTRAKRPAMCENDLCYSVCFTNRSSCDIYNVSAVFIFNEMSIIKMDATDTVLDGFCQSDEVCSPNTSCVHSVSKVKRSVLHSDRLLSDQLLSTNTHPINVNAPIEMNYLESEEMDCSNVCPSAAEILLFDKSVVATAVFLYVCIVF